MIPARPDLVCLSHLRWGFVYQRPQHLLSRFARSFRVFFVEEPMYSKGEPRLDIRVDEESGVYVVVPQLPENFPWERYEPQQSILLSQLLSLARIEKPVLWYYTPMALGFSRDVPAAAVIYDCMDELSGFKFAPPELHDRERELFRKADLVFTGGQSLFEAKRELHPSVHAFPSSVDAAQFGQARRSQAEPADQAGIPHPRVGYCGVIDERLDLDLLRGMAALRPEWHWIMVGPVIKIEPSTLPQAPNIHYLGGKSYKELPAYLAGWDAAMLPFARNESTRFISPTKTPEYLAAGKPSVSTSIRDVVRPYGEEKLVGIADTPEDFVTALEQGMSAPRDLWLSRVDAFLKGNSWEITWSRMMALLESRIKPREQEHQKETVESL